MTKVDLDIEEIIEFMGKVPPFQFLEEDELREVALGVKTAHFAKDEIVHHEGGTPGHDLNVVKRGGVKLTIRSESDEDMVIDYRGEGDSFGFLSLASGDKSRTTITAIDDTVCYLVSKKTIMGLLDKHPSFTEYFLRSFFNKFIDKTFDEMKSKNLLVRGGDKLLFTTQVGELIKNKPITGKETLTIKEASLMMSDNEISSLVIVDQNDVPVGIVTDNDLRSKVVARERDVNDLATDIMSVTLIKSDARAYCFEALLSMIRYGIHHLLIVENGKLKGIVSNHDFMTLQSTSPLSLVHQIESQTTVEGLIPLCGQINGIIVMLLQEGARASNITRILTEVNDRLLKKVLEIAERKFGPSPVPYCWIAYGSEGRTEQTFKTDQDNAIIYADPVSDNEAKVAGVYFEKFAEFVNESLVLCGFTRCPGNYMAKNPKWRQPFSVWKKYFKDWISTPTPEAMLFSVIIFDFRALHGELSLAHKLRDFVAAEAMSHGMFLKQLADMAASVKPPLGFFNNFIVEKDGRHKDELNLKFKCIAPLINIIRLFAMEKGIKETSTRDRLRAMAITKGMGSSYAHDLEHIFEFVMLLRIHHQFEQIRAGEEPDNFINPQKLSTLEKKTLKEACKLINNIQDAIQMEYNPGMVI